MLADGAVLSSELFPPDGDGSFPGVVVLHESFGLNDDVRRLAMRFAGAGYVAMCPDLYSHGSRIVCLTRVIVDMLRGSVAREIEDILAAREALAARSEVDPERIAVAGFCQGGGFALVAATKPGFRAGAWMASVPLSPATVRKIASSVAPPPNAWSDTWLRLACPTTSRPMTKPVTRSSRSTTATRAGLRECRRRWRSATTRTPPRVAGGGCSRSSRSTSGRSADSRDVRPHVVQRQAHAGRDCVREPLVTLLGQAGEMCSQDRRANKRTHPLRT